MAGLTLNAPSRTLTLAFTLALAALTGAAQATTLYDPALGSLPTAQGWTPIPGGNPAAQSLVGGRLRTDTQTDPGAVQFVDYFSPPSGALLDTVAGFTLSFGLQVLAEAHQSVNRAGYSVLVQGLDETKALELSFWGNEVWALGYTAGGVDSGYVHGNGAVLDTSSSFHQYALTVQNNAYTLRVDGSAVLSGTMIDYPVQGPTTAAYGLSNALFFGDDSSRGQSITDLGLVSITAVPVPEPAAAWLWVAGVCGLALRRRR